ncbi:hypothetical protein [Vibrio diabolicus]
MYFYLSRVLAHPVLVLHKQLYHGMYSGDKVAAQVSFYRYS